jgi:hypothetical protein
MGRLKKTQLGYSEEIMSGTPFAAPYAKITRTERQIEEIDQAVQSFAASAPFEITSRVDAAADEQIWSFKLKTNLPPDISVQAGEVIHNLRSSLDQCLSRQSPTMIQALRLALSSPSAKLKRNLRRHSKSNLNAFRKTRRR